MRTSRIAIIALLVMAPNIGAAATWYYNHTTLAIYLMSTGGELVQFIPVGTVNNPAGCPNSDGYVGRTNVKGTLALLMSAWMANKKVHVLVSTTSCDSSTGRPLFTDVGASD